MAEKIRREKIEEAIKMGVSYVKPWPSDSGKTILIRCLDAQAGYGKHVDLTEEEYKAYQTIVNLTEEQLMDRLDKYTKGELK